MLAAASARSGGRRFVKQTGNRQSAIGNRHPDSFPIPDSRFPIADFD